MVRVNTRKLKQDIDDAVGFAVQYNSYFDDAIAGLTPIGDTGLYVTPDEPADPTDCDRYPDSPFCGGNPFSRDPIALNPEIVINQCDIGITFNPVLGFVKLPPFTLVYRKPECRIPQEEDYTDYSESDKPSLDLPNLNPELRVLVYLNHGASRNEYHNDVQGLLTPPYRYESTGKEFSNWTWRAFYCELEGQAVGGYSSFSASHKSFLLKRDDRYPFDVLEPGTNSLESFNTDSQPDNFDRYRQYIYAPPKPSSFLKTSPLLFPRNSVIPPLASTNAEFKVGVWAFQGLNYNQSATGLDIHRWRKGSTPIAVSGKWKDVKRYLINFNNTYNFSGHSSGGEGREFYEHQITTTVNLQIAKILIADSCSEPLISPPPLPKDKCCMGCCPPQNDDLLKTILKKVNKLSEIVGVDDYPVSVPESLISRGGGLLEELVLNPNKDILSLTQLFTWYVERFDEIMGQFEIPIEIKDTDPATPGDQSKMMKFPNVAETLAEAMMLLMQLSINSELHTNIINRILVETGQDKKQNFITYKSVESLVDYLGYKTKNKEAKLPLMFTPDKTGFEEILKECEIPVSVTEYDEKLNLQADLMRFREAAAMIKANNFVKLDPNSDIKTQIMKRLLDLSGLLKDTTSEKPSDDFDEFLAAVEQGFTNTAGVGDPAKPYGRSYEDRPRIRRIKKVDSEDPG